VASATAAAQAQADALLGRAAASLEERGDELVGQQDKLAAELAALKSSLELSMSQQR
jgi:hypothetical protein